MKIIQITAIAMLFACSASAQSKKKDSITLQRDIEAIKNGKEVKPVKNKSLVVITDTVPKVDSTATQPALPVHASPRPNNPNPHDPRPTVTNPNLPPKEKETGKKGTVNKRKNQ